MEIIQGSLGSDSLNVHNHNLGNGKNMLVKEYISLTNKAVL